MTNYHSPVQAVMDMVVTVMSSEGYTIPHTIGGLHKHDNTSPPRYVWLPRRYEPQPKYGTAGLTDFRPLVYVNAEFQVRCDGANLDHAAALAHVLMVALYRALPDWTFTSLEFVGPGEAYNQAAELVVLTGSVFVPIFDAFLDPTALNSATGPKAANKPPIPMPEPEGVYLARVNSTIHRSPDPETDGTEPVPTSTSP